MTFKKNTPNTDYAASNLNTQEKLHLYELLLNNSMEYTFIHLDMEGKIIDGNPRVELMYEYSVLELIGQKISKLYIKDTLLAPTIITQVKKLGHWMGEMTAINNGGRKHNDSIILIRRSNKLGKHIGYTMIAKPLKSEEQLQCLLSQESLQIRNKELEDINNKMHEISRLKDQFLANMSHDLRTPLNSIIGFAEIMVDGKAGPISSQHKEYLNDILSSAYDLLSLINDILDLAKIEAGKIDFNPIKIRLDSFLDELKNVFNQVITQKHIIFDIKIDPGFEITIDPDKLKQVLYNLVSNALKFTNPGGAVTIKASKESRNTFRLAVEDTGIGIEEKDFKRLFIPFQQLITGAVSENTGTGLGLAMTRRIVEAQGGTINVESTFGKGSIFYIILPCFTPKGEHSYIKPLEQTKQTPCVLIIEEKTPAREELVVDLIKNGYKVNVANNIDGAIENYKVYKADAIILDFFISDISKWELLRAFRRGEPFEKAPVLLITGGVSNVEAFGFKIHDFLVQPLKTKELVDALQWSGAAPHTHKKVLIIDDDKTAIKLANKILKKHGYYAQFETDLNKALAHIEAEYPDVIILNAFIESEDLNGFEFLQYLRHCKKTRYTPIVITTLKILTQEERERIKGEMQRVLIRKEGIAYSLINEIKKQFPISEK